MAGRTREVVAIDHDDGERLLPVTTDARSEDIDDAQVSMNNDFVVESNPESHEAVEASRHEEVENRQVPCSSFQVVDDKFTVENKVDVLQSGSSEGSPLVEDVSGDERYVRADAVCAGGSAAKELFQKVVGKRPVTHVGIGDANPLCLLDSGSESSLMSQSFFEKHVLGQDGVEFCEVKGIQVVGIGGKEGPPATTLVRAPIKIGEVLLPSAYFLLISGLPSNELSVLIGCNILHEMWSKKVDIRSLGPEAEVWSRVLSVVADCAEVRQPYLEDECWAARTCKRSVVVPPGTSCYLDVFSDIPKDRSGPFMTEPVFNVDIPNLEVGCVVSDRSLGGDCKVLVTNVSRYVCVVIPPRTKLCTVRSVTPTVQVSQCNGTLLTRVTYEVADQTRPSNTVEPDPADDGAEAESDPSVLPDRTKFTFSDGTTYLLPPGLSLDQCEVTEKEKERIVREMIMPNEDRFIMHEHDIGRCDVSPHQCRLVDDTPVDLPYRRIPPQHIQEVKSIIENWLRLGVIRKSTSEYASPIVLVKKKDQTLRLCVDYRLINSKIQKEAFPTPRIDELIESMGGCEYFSVWDMAHGYLQMAMHKDSVKYTAFRVPWGHYEFLCTPFGMKNSGSNFQRVLEYGFGDLNLQQLVLYIDDLVSKGIGFDPHLAANNLILSRLRWLNLKVRGKKCQLFCKQIEFCGHIVSKEGVRPDPERIKKVQEWPVPRSPEKLRSFYFLASWFRKFIKDFARITVPLSKLLNVQPKDFKWGETEQASFEATKRALTSPPVLGFPDFEKPFVLEVDACAVSLGAVLLQHDELVRLHPIAFASRQLRKAEKAYAGMSSYKLELLGLKWAISEKFRQYLQWNHFDVYTDNNPLTHILSAKLGATETNWLAQLSQFDFSIHYKAGKSNVVADALSRYPYGAQQETKVGDIKTLRCAEMLATNGPSMRCAEMLATSSSPQSIGVPDSPCPAEDRVSEHSPAVRMYRELRARGDAVGEVVPLYVSASTVNDDVCQPVSVGVVDVLAREPGEMLRSQESDSEVTNLIQLVQSNGVEHDDPRVPRSWKKHFANLRVVDGVLCRERVTDLGERALQYAVPRSDRRRMCTWVHKEWGHQGVQRSFEVLRRHCFWPGMLEDVGAVVRECVHCTQVKRPKIAQRAALAHIVAHRPLELVCLDFLKLDRAERGIEDVLVCTDAFSRFAVAIPCPDQTAATTAAKFRDHFICVYGFPERVHSDQGRNFESVLVAELCRLFKIKKSHTTTYHPQGNAITERFNRTLIQLLLSFQANTRKSWPSLLPRVCFLYNSTPHSSTGVAPFRLMFGREPRLPDLGLTRPQDWETPFVEEETRRWKEIAQVVDRNAQAAQTRNKRAWDTRVRSRKLTPGMVVFRQRTGFTDRHKLADFHRSERYLVEIVSEDGTGCVIRPVGGGPPERVHRDKLVAVPGERQQDEPGQEQTDVGDEGDDTVVVEVELPTPPAAVLAGERDTPVDTLAKAPVAREESGALDRDPLTARDKREGARQSARENRGVPPQRFTATFKPRRN